MRTLFVLILVCLSQDAKPVTLKVVSATGFDSSEVRFRKIAERTQDIVSSADFKASVIGWYFKGRRQFQGTTDTNKQVFQKITSKDWEVGVQIRNHESFDGGIHLSESLMDCIE